MVPLLVELHTLWPAGAYVIAIMFTARALQLGSCYLLSLLAMSKTGVELQQCMKEFKCACILMMDNSLLKSARLHMQHHLHVKNL